MKTLFESSYYNNLGGYVKEYMSTNSTTVNVHDTLSDVVENELLKIDINTADKKAKDDDSTRTK